MLRRLMPVALAAVLTGIALAACGGALAPAASPQDPGLSVLVWTPDLGVGSNRLALTVLSPSGAPPQLEWVAVEDRAADLTLTYGRQVNGAVAEWKTASSLTWHDWPVKAGVYVMWPEFDAAGIWEITATMRDGDGSVTGRTAVQVNQRTSTPRIGDMAPDTPTKTARTVEEAQTISSAASPDPDMYAVSLGWAVRSGKPVVVLFATPAFCTSTTCGPQLDVIEELKDRYRVRAHFVHVEIYSDPQRIRETGDLAAAEYNPAVETWGLQTEPFTFLVDAGGRVFAKFEGFTTIEELDPAVAALVGA